MDPQQTSPEELAKQITEQHDKLISGNVINPSAKGIIGIEMPKLPMPKLPGGTIPPTSGQYVKKPTDASSYAHAFVDHIKNADQYAQDTYKYGKQRSYNADYTGANFDKYYSYGATWDKFGFSPFRDNEALYNANSGWGENFRRGMTGFGKTFGIGFSNMLPWNAWSDNPTEERETAEKYSKAHAIYGDTRGGFWAGFNNLAIDAGLSLGMVSEMATEEAALWIGGTLAAPFTGGTSEVGAAAETVNLFSKAGKMFNLMDMGKKVTKTWEGLKALKEINSARKFYELSKGVGKGILKGMTPHTIEFGSDLLKDIKAGGKLNALATTAKGFGAFYRDTRAISMARSEAKLEGSMVYNDLVKDLGNDFYTKNGRNPKAEEWQSIYTTAENASRETYVWNIPALLLSNQIVFGKTFKGFPGLRTLSREASEGLSGRLVAEEAYWKTGEGKAWNVVKDGWGEKLKSLTKAATWKPKNLLRTSIGGLAGYAKHNLVEAFQEQFQDALSQSTKDYYTQIYHDPLKVGYNEAMGFFAKRLGQQFTTSQGWQTFASGFFMGGLVQFPQHVMFTSIPTQFQKWTNPKQFAENQKKREDWTNNVVNAMNAVTANPFKYFHGPESSLINQKNKADTMDQAAMDDDQYTHQNAVDESLFEHMHTLMQSGKIDLVKDYLTDMKGLSGEELAQAFGEQEGTPEDVKAFYTKQIDKSLGVAEDVQKRYDYINKTFVNPFDYHRFSMDKEPEKRVREMNNYLAFEEAKKHAIYSSYAFDKTIDRMSSIMNDVTTNKPVGKASANDFTVLFDSNTDSETGIVKEIKNLKAEIGVYEKGTGTEKRLADRKKKKLAALEDMHASILNFQDALERKDKENLSPEQVAENQRMAHIREGAKIKTKKGVTAKIERVNGDRVQIKENGKLKWLKRKNVELIEKSSAPEPADYLDEAQSDLHGSYEQYLKTIASLNDDHVFNNKIMDSFKKLRDFYRLKHDSNNLSWAVNALHDPTYFTQYAERAANIFNSLHAQRIEDNKRLYEQFLSMRDKNDLLNRIFEMKVFLHPDDVKALIDNATVPSRFFDAVTFQPLKPEDPKYREVLDLIENWEGFTGRTLTNRPISGAENIAPGYDPSARPKFESDKRTYADYAKQYGFDPQSAETEVELQKVLSDVIQSKYASRREKLVARRLLSITKQGMKVKFVNNHNTPGSYDAGTDTLKIDARYSGSDFRGGVMPFEHVIIHEVIHKFTVEGYHTDKEFKTKIDSLLDEAKKAFQQKTVDTSKLELSPGQLPYGLNDPLEFIAEAMSNDRFQAFLHMIPHEGTAKTAWQEFLSSIKMFLSRVLGVAKDHSMLDEAIGVITSKIDEAHGETTTEAELPEEKGTAQEMITFTTPVTQMPEELQKDLIEVFRAVNRDRLENGEDLLDAMALELDDAGVLRNEAFKNFVRLGLFSKVRNTIDKYNKKTGRTAAPTQVKVEPKVEPTIEQPKVETVASVGIVIPNKIRRTLIEDMGYSREDVKKMTPEEAIRLVKENITKESVTLKQQQAEALQVEEKVNRMHTLQKEVSDRMSAVKNLEDLNEFESFMQDLLQDPEDRALLNLTGEQLDDIIEIKKKALAQSFGFDDLVVGETVVMTDPKFKNMMTVIDKTATEVKLRPFGEVTGAVTILTKNQVDEKRVIKYRYSPDMKKTVTEEPLTEQEVKESDTAVENAIKDETTDIAEDLKNASEKSNEENTKNFMDSLNNCKK